MVPPEVGVDTFRDKEDEENPLPIFPSGSHGITVTEADMSTLRREGIAFDDNNDPAPENVMQYDDVFSTPSSPTFGFRGINNLRQSGNFPVGRAKLKTTPIQRIQHMSRLDFFIKLCFMEYIKDVVIPKNNKHINSPMNSSEYFRVLGCHLIKACYVGHSVREFFLKDPITPQKGAPIRLNPIISGRHLDKNIQVKSYTNIAITDFSYPFLW